MDHRNEFQKRIGVGERQHRFGRHAGTTREVEIMREDNGKLGGISTERWDGSNDVRVFADTAELTMDSKTGKVTQQ